MVIRKLLGSCDLVNRFFGDDGVVLELDLARGLIEHRPENPVTALQSINATTLPSLRANLRKAVGDPHVIGLIVHAAGTPQPISVYEEVGELIEEFSAHKPTVAWAETFGEMTSALGAYLMASAAHEIWLQPTGDLTISGIELHIVLLKGMLTKMGITPEFGQRYEYKSAADRFAADSVSEANREMMQQIANSVVDSCIESIARRRSLTPEQLRELIDQGRFTAPEAIKVGLIDHIGYRDEVYANILQQWNAEPRQLRFVSKYQSKLEATKVFRQRNAAKVAVISLRGAITTGRGTSMGLNGETVGCDVIEEQFRQVRREGNFAAVVFAIDSPGGSAVASDAIRRAVTLTRKAGIPVVATMGAVAASGGYYAAMGCNEIVTHATTLTGSIGVLGGKLVTQGLYDKLGLKREAVRAGARAGGMSPVDPFDEDFWAELDKALDRIYDDFTHKAALDRGMDYQQLESLARGRVWTGADAKQRGLVDHIGGRRLALQRACDLAGLDIETIRLTALGGASFVQRFVAAKSSESSTGTGIGVQWHSGQDVENLLIEAARTIGIRIDGALSLPLRFQIS